MISDAKWVSCNANMLYHILKKQERMFGCFMEVHGSKGSLDTDCRAPITRTCLGRGLGGPFSTYGDQYMSFQACCWNLLHIDWPCIEKSVMLQFVQQYKYDYTCQIQVRVADVGDLSDQPELWLSRYHQLMEAVSTAASGSPSTITLLNMPTTSGGAEYASQRIVVSGCFPVDR